MSTLQTLVSILGLSFVAGINLYAAVLVVGLGIRYEWIRGLPESLHVLAHPAVLILAGLLYLIEFLADKIPYVTPIWDALHTLIRPLGAAALAVGAAGELHPLAQVIAGLVGGSLALGTHSTKMGVRLLAHSAPEPMSHSTISIAEDVGVVSLLVLAYHYPWVALAVLTVLIIIVALMLPVLLRALRFLLAGFAGWLGALFPTEGGLPAMSWPRWLQAQLEGSPAPTLLVLPAYVRKLARAGRWKKVFLVRQNSEWAVYAKGMSTLRVHALKEAPELAAGFFYDVLAWKLPAGSFASVYLTRKWAERWRAAAPSSAPGAASRSAAIPSSP